MVVWYLLFVKKEKKKKGKRLVVVRKKERIGVSSIKKIGGCSVKAVELWLFDRGCEFVNGFWSCWRFL